MQNEFCLWKIREKRPGLQKEKIPFHQDNAPCHKSILTMAKMHELKFESLEHPPHSPDLAPSDFHLFPDFPDSHFRDGIHRLEDRWSKCINFQVDYTE